MGRVSDGHPEFQAWRTGFRDMSSQWGVTKPAVECQSSRFGKRVTLALADLEPFARQQFALRDDFSRQMISARREIRKRRRMTNRPGSSGRNAAYDGVGSCLLHLLLFTFPPFTLSFSRDLPRRPVHLPLGILRCRRAGE